MNIDEERWEVIRGDGPDGGFVELWDRLLAPDGLALEVVETAEGDVAVAGHGVMVPLQVATAFVAQARAYLLNQ